MILTETSVFTINDSTTHPDCSTMSTDRYLNASRRTDPSPAADRGRHWLRKRLTRYMLAVLAALSVLPAAAQDLDTTAPALSSVWINGVGLRLTYNEELDNNSDPDNSAFTVTVNGTSRNVRTVIVIRTLVLVFLDSPVQAGETVTVSYTVPATNPVQDLAGNRAAAIQPDCKQQHRGDRTARTDEPHGAGWGQIGDTDLDHTGQWRQFHYQTPIPGKSGIG